MPRKTKSPSAPAPAPAPPQGRGALTLADYTPTEAEMAPLRRFKKRLAETSAAPRVKVRQEAGGTALAVAHDREGVGLALLADALGTADNDFVQGMLRQLANAVLRGGKVGEAELNFLISVIKDLKPRDQFEAMLAAQMAVTHEAAMTFARRLGNADNIPQQDSAINGFTKLTRTFAGQLEALKRYRASGEQKVTVQHVNVGEGGQAIVGHVTTQTAPALAPEHSPARPPALSPSRERPAAMVNDNAAAPVAQRRTPKNG